LMMVLVFSTRYNVAYDETEDGTRDSKGYDRAPDAEGPVVVGLVICTEELGAVDAADVGAHYYSVVC
jgi:hypothetical protein